MFYFQRRFRYINRYLVPIVYVVLTATLMSACGSGSESDSSSAPDTTPPIVGLPEQPGQENNSKNILLIISDDQGLDASAQFDFSSDQPTTPNIDELAARGLTFENAWATPACTTSRASLLTGLYPHNSNVTFVPAILSDDYQTLPQLLRADQNTQEYELAVFGKWHLGGASPNLDHPSSVGVEHYAGNLFNMDDYYSWELTENGVQSVSEVYHTTKITDLAIEWISEQSGPWVSWVAYSAPHAPFHLPPNDLHSQNLSGEASDINLQPRAYYLAAIEAMDTEIGRLLSSIDGELENTLVIFIGDNGSPTRVVDTSVYSKAHSKGSLYEGSLAVPLIVAGAEVGRVNEREAKPVAITDLFATIAQAAGYEQSKIKDSSSFYSLLSDSSAEVPAYIFTEFESAETTGAAVRSQTYKLIRFANGEEELYSLRDNFSESQNLINSTNTEDLAALTALREFMNSIDPLDLNEARDITDAILTNRSNDCADYISSYRSTATDVGRQLVFNGSLEITVTDDLCIFNANAIPNHDFNDGGQSFPNPVSEQDDQFEISRSPTIAIQKTDLSLTIDNAILLNSVKVDIIAAACFGVGDGKVGCNDMSSPWRYDPMFPANGFRVDSHHAHAQPDGTYHYHGSPQALFADNSSQASPVIGFAADGFPIYGSYFEDADGNIRKARSSYILREGERPSTNGGPGGTYDGTFRDDYTFDARNGDLDECNGMTINGSYAYFVTDDFPYVLGCFSGSVNESFYK
jgi:arylsulfatase A-like enzyme